jgi:hypothetical protein
MSLRRQERIFLVLAALALLFGAAGLREFPHADAAPQSAGISDATQAKIARAMSAGPDNIARSARIVDTDTNGNTVVLREGSNGFTCMPGNPEVIGEPPMCVDAASLRWFADAKAHKPRPTNTVPGITYMLAGATQRTDSDPNDTTSPPIHVGHTG